jgi:hypothetical protein
MRNYANSLDPHILYSVQLGTRSFPNFSVVFSSFAKISTANGVFIITVQKKNQLETSYIFCSFVEKSNFFSFPVRKKSTAIVVSIVYVEKKSIATVVLCSSNQ